MFKACDLMLTDGISFIGEFPLVTGKPAVFLAFTGVQPGMKVLDVAAGGGSTSQLLALAVGTAPFVFLFVAGMAVVGVGVSAGLLGGCSSCPFLRCRYRR